jgi:hypothetical protein
VSRVEVPPAGADVRVLVASAVADLQGAFALVWPRWGDDVPEEQRQVAAVRALAVQFALDAAAIADAAVQGDVDGLQFWIDEAAAGASRRLSGVLQEIGADPEPPEDDDDEEEVDL